MADQTVRPLIGVDNTNVVTRIKDATHNQHHAPKKWKRNRGHGKVRTIVFRTIRDFLPELIRVSNEPSRFEPKTPCWIWTGDTTPAGYGVLHAEGGSWRVHRLSFLLHKGKFGGGRCVCHTCDNPPCCNPEHLWGGTDSQNQLDRIKWSATIEEEEMAAIRASLFSTPWLASKHKITKSQVRVIRPLGPMLNGTVHLTRRNYWTGEDPSNP